MWLYQCVLAAYCTQFCCQEIFEFLKYLESVNLLSLRSADNTDQTLIKVNVGLQTELGLMQDSIPTKMGTIGE